MGVLSRRLAILFRTMVQKELDQSVVGTISSVKVMLSCNGDVRAIFRPAIWLQGKKYRKLSVRRKIRKQLVEIVLGA